MTAGSATLTGTGAFGTSGTVPVTIGSGSISAAGTSNLYLSFPAGHNLITNTSNGDILRLADPGASVTGFLTIEAGTGDAPIWFNTNNSANANQSFAFQPTGGGSGSQVIFNMLTSAEPYVSAGTNAYNCGGATGFVLVCSNEDKFTGGGPNLLNVAGSVGGGSTGGRIGSNFQYEIASATADTTNSFFQAGNFAMTTVAPAGGTTGSPMGSTYGLAIYNNANSGSTNYIENTGLAVEMQIASGASTLYARGVDVQLQPGNTGAPTDEFLAYTVASAVEGQGTVTCAYCIGRTDSHNPMAAGGTVLGFILEAGDTSPTIANGIDFHLLKFSGNAYNDGHVVISGTGAITMPLTTGTPATYACFTSGGTLISSATAC